MKNMMRYTMYGGKEFFSNSQRYLERRIQLECDGRPIQLPQRLQGLVLLNIPSYMAGTNFWGTERGKDVSVRREGGREGGGSMEWIISKGCTDTTLCTFASSCLVHTTLLTTTGMFLPVGGACCSATAALAGSVCLCHGESGDFEVNSSRIDRT